MRTVPVLTVLAEHWASISERHGAHVRGVAEAPRVGPTVR